MTARRDILDTTAFIRVVYYMNTDLLAPADQEQGWNTFPQSAAMPTSKTTNLIALGNERAPGELEIKAGLHDTGQ